MEILFLDALAFRYGNSTRVGDGISSWGAGIILDERLLGPFTVQVDFGEMSYDSFFINDDKTMWGVQARYNF